nr:zinc finger, CCHC-type [Tanacetum cinerariifolium]
MTTNFEKLDKFEGYDFRRWQKKMHFLLTTLKENDDYICRGHILNDMSDSLFDVYMNVETAKELWDSLESNHLRIEESLRAQDHDKGKDKETGHFKRDCHSGKKNNANAGGSGKGLRTNPKTKVDEIEWWIDSSATTHVCKDRCWFRKFKPVKEGSVLYMGDEHFAPVHGKGNVALKFSSRKTITLFNVLYVPKLQLLEDAPMEAIKIRAKWENDDYICRGHILNDMSDSLFNVYANAESAKELWDSLESKYMAEDSSSKKFIKYGEGDDYELWETRQFEGHDFRRWKKKMHFLLTTLKVVYVLTTPMPELLKDATVEAIRIRAKWENDDYICRGHILNGMSDSLFNVYTNVESATELWDSIESKYMAGDSLSKKFLDFKHTLKHGKDDLSLVQLGSHLRIEESLRAQDSDKGKGKEVDGPSINMTEEGGNNKHHKQNKGIAEVVQRTTQMLMVRERGLRTNPKTKVDAIAWCIDSGAITHVCKDRCWFKTYEPVKDGYVLYMGDDHFAPIHGKGSVALEFSSGKTITLFNVLYVPKLRKNLVSGPMLNKCGYKQVYESDKYILSKSGAFVGFGYYNNGMFMLNLNKVPDDSDSVYMSSAAVVNSSLWHARLGHVHYKRILEMSKDDLIPAIDENPEKCTTCMLTKITRKPFQKAKDAIFDENRFSSIPRPKDIIPNVQESQMDDHTDDVANEIPEPQKDPRIYNEATQSRDAAFWKEAIDDEIGSIMENNTWVLSDLPPGCKPLGCKWIFKRKMKVDGTVAKFKARLVIQGFRQKEGIDYFDTYAPVARITTIRLLLSLAAIHNLVVYQMDVKTSFLNGYLEEEVYMKQPEGFVMPSNEHKVCKLVKSLYTTDQNQVDKTKKFLSLRFSMKDMGEVDVILGIKIKRENKRTVITHSHYIEKILKKFNRKDCSPLEYSRAIGCLMYAMISTRPDNAYDVGRLSRFTSNHSRQHWKEITRVFKYLRGTKDYGLSYVRYPSVLEGYSDASWINHVEDSSSMSGWVFLLGGGAISWASKKQTCITSSTMEFEFVALAADDKEAEWLRNLIHEILIWPKPIAPISIRCDSAPTMARAYSHIYNGKSRHLSVRHSMVRELIRNGVISIEFVRTQHNLVDHLTKGLARDLVNNVLVQCFRQAYPKAEQIFAMSADISNTIKEDLA